MNAKLYLLRILGASLVLTVAACKSAPSAQAGRDAGGQQSGRIAEAAIPFANNGGIRNWQPLDDSTLLIEDQFGQYYLARLTAPSLALAFTETVGFVTSPSGTFDRSSSVSIKGARYGLASFERTNRPAKGKAANDGNHVQGGGGAAVPAKP